MGRILAVQMLVRGDRVAETAHKSEALDDLKVQYSQQMRTLLRVYRRRDTPPPINIRKTGTTMVLAEASEVTVCTFYLSAGPG